MLNYNSNSTSIYQPLPSSNRMNTAPENEPTGTTADIDKAKTFFSMLPSLRDTSVDDFDYMRKAAMDDILKDILEKVAGRNVDIHFTISCILRNPTQYLSPGYLYQFINWCLGFVSTNIYTNEWYWLAFNFISVHASLQPILTELAKEAGYDAY